MIVRTIFVCMTDKTDGEGPAGHDSIEDYALSLLWNQEPDNTKEMILGVRTGETIHVYGEQYLPSEHHVSDEEVRHALSLAN